MNKIKKKGGWNKKMAESKDNSVIQRIILFRLSGINRGSTQEQISRIKKEVWNKLNNFLKDKRKKKKAYHNSRRLELMRSSMITDKTKYHKKTGLNFQKRLMS